MNASRQIHSAFLLAITLTVSAASLVLMLAEGSTLPVGLTPFIAILAVYLNDRRRLLVLPTIGANIFGVAAVIAAAIELYLGTVEARILAGAHLIVYITWVVLFMKKQNRQYWWLIALSVLQLAVSCVLTRSPLLGMSLIGMLVLLIWTLALFTLHRLQLRVAVPETHQLNSPGRSGQRQLVVYHGVQTDSVMSWIGMRFRLMILGMCLASLLMSGITFAAFPRVFIGNPLMTGNSRSANTGLIQRTGFREQVKLGEFGRLLTSNERVLRIQVTDQFTGNSINPDRFVDAMGMDELLIRGSTMGLYRDSAWHSGMRENQALAEMQRRSFSRATSTERCYRVEITQEPPIGTFAFAPSPVISARLMNSDGRLLKRNFSEALVFDVNNFVGWQRGTGPDFNSQAITFQVFCLPQQIYARRTPPVDLPNALLNWLYPNSRSSNWRSTEDTYARRFAITQDLDTVVPRLYDKARELLEDSGRLMTPSEYVQRVARLLRDSGEYSYSLTVLPTDTSLDPVEDFLFNHKTGHCQYFATASVLMLQSVGIPARVVNGFKGFEINQVSGETEVRQKHAHVWVEYRENGHWHTFDPTPGSREEFLQNTDDPGVLQDLQAAVNDLWDAGIGNVTPERQRAAIQPVLSAFTENISQLRQLGVIGTIKAMWNSIRSDPSRWFNWRAFLWVIACLAPLALLLRRRPLRWFRRFFSWLSDRWNPRRRTATHIVRFYENFCRYCARAGLSFPVSQTARENAELACNHFLTHSSPELRAIPGRIADAFNAVRYGDHLLTGEQTEQLGRDMLLLKAAIENNRHHSG